MGVKVSRQRYHDNNQLAVELCVGTKFIGEDILPAKYPSEGKYLTMPEDALKDAIEIQKRWAKDYSDERTFISLVNADGKGDRMIFDPTVKSDVAKLKKAIDTISKEMEKCGFCSKPMGNRTPLTINDLKGAYCCETCIASKYRGIYNAELPTQNISAKDKAKKKAKP